MADGMQYKEGPSPQYKLDTCVWELTLACTLRCEHCGSNAGKALEDQLTLSEALDVAKQLADMRCRRVPLIGGEVFLFPGWEQVARLMVDAGVDVSIITNGSCFNESAWRQLEASGVRHVAVSIDGCRASHDAQRREGSFDAAISSLRALKQRGYIATAITTVTQANFPDLENLHGILIEAGADGWQIQLYSPIVASSLCQTPTVDQAREILRFVSRVRAKRTREGKGMLVVAADNVGYFTPEELGVRLLPGGCFPGCGAGLSVIGIDSCGNVTGCESLRDSRFIEGNLRERCLVEIWNDPGAFAYNRQFTTGQLEGACAACSMAARCKGGCRSMNFYHTGSLFRTNTCARGSH